MAEQRSERVTMLTDFLLALVAGALAVRLQVFASQGEESWLTGWVFTFSFTAAAALAGGLFHGLRHHTGERVSEGLWRLTLVLTAVVGLCLVLVAGWTGVGAPARISLWIFGFAKLLLVLLLLWRSWSFAVVAVDSGISLLVLGAVAGRGLYAGALGGEGWWIVAGVALSLVGAAVQQARLWADRPFDHNDLFHLVQIVASLLFFRGAA